MNKEIAELTAWSLQHALSGVAPTEGFYNEPFDRKSYRYSMAGKQLGGGFKFFVGIVGNFLILLAIFFGLKK